MDPELHQDFLLDPDPHKTNADRSAGFHTYCNKFEGIAVDESLALNSLMPQYRESPKQLRTGI